LCVRRRFQIQRITDAATLARAETEYACIELSSGRPVRWPTEFRERYVSAPDVLAVIANLPSL
jgi:acyl-CoA thioester hydrolase